MSHTGVEAYSVGIPRILHRLQRTPHRLRTGMFGLRECDRFGAPPKRLLGGVVGFYEALGGLLARYFVRAGVLGRPFLFKWGVVAQKIVGCVLSPVWVNPVSSTDSLRQYYAYSH